MSELEDKWFWAYPTESVNCDGITGSAHEVYSKSDVDSVIAELKDKCQMHDFFWEGCGFAKRGFKNSIAVSEAFDELEVELAEKDKEIAELEERIADGDKDFEMVNNQNERLIKTVLHHKHKRCLAIAMWCAAEFIVNQNNYKVFQTHRSKFRIGLFQKWYFRWLAIAEKFKEAK